VNLPEPQAEPKLFDGGTTNSRIRIVDWEAQEGKVVRIMVARGIDPALLEQLRASAAEAGCAVEEAPEGFEPVKLAELERRKAVGSGKSIGIQYGMGAEKFRNQVQAIPMPRPNRAQRRAADRARRKGTR
jgi:hypothetical protein